MIKALFQIALGTVLSVIKFPFELAFKALAGDLRTLTTPLGAATKAGVVIGFVFIIVYVCVFEIETPIERTVLLISTVGSLVAGFILGAKS